MGRTARRGNLSMCILTVLLVVYILTTRYRWQEKLASHSVKKTEESDNSNIDAIESQFAQRLDARFLSPSTSINGKTHEVARLSRCQVVSDQMHLAGRRVERDKASRGDVGETRTRPRDETAAGYKGKRKKARTRRRRGRNPVGQGHPPSATTEGSNHRPYVTALESRS